PAIPALAETLAVAAILALARHTGARVHLCRLSTAEGVSLVRAAREAGLAVSCDVSVNHLHLSEMDIGFFDPQAHLVPPLRAQRDRDALRAGLADGTIDALCSDHTPVDDDAKQLPFGESEPGATGLELLLPLALKWAEETGAPLATALARVTMAPAGIMGIDAGHLTPGAAADLCIFDPEAWWTVDPRALKSQGRNSPFLGLELRGRVRYTLVAGHIVFEA
ncbi:MAG TPA: amidohydrolase family protein, partial [Burkholderiales bacterium]